MKTRTKNLKKLMFAPVTLNQLHTAHCLFDALTATTGTFDRDWVLQVVGDELEHRYGRRKGLNILARFLEALQFLKHHWAELVHDNYIIVDGIVASLLQALAEAPLDESYLEGCKWSKRLSYFYSITLVLEVFGF